MKRFLPLLFLLLSAPLYATTWYATSSSANINATSLWVPTSTGSCTGSGTALVWGAQANGDVFDANGCTLIELNVDPGTATGASQGVCGTTTVQVTIQSNASHGGSFQYQATTLVIHANVIAGSNSYAVLMNGSGGGTLCGTVTGSSVTTSTEAINVNTSGTIQYIIGNVTGGSVSSALGIDGVGSGALTVIGNVTSGSATAAYGMSLAVGGSGSVTVNGNCVGSNTVAPAGCYSFGTAGTFTLNGNIINGLKATGQYGPILYTPSATNYILYPKDSSYTLGTINSHATLMPTDPGSTNVKSGVVYGPNTGSYSGGSSICTTGGW